MFLTVAAIGLRTVDHRLLHLLGLGRRPPVRVLPRAPDADADGAEGAGRIGTLRSRIGLPGEPVDQLLVEASIRARPVPEPIAILRGCACSDTGSVTVSTPRS